MPAAVDFVALPPSAPPLDPNLKVHFSQFGEELVVNFALYKHFAKTNPGFYIDVGAHHPTLYSTTAILYHYGWRGINIDVSREAIDLLKAARPRDTSIQAGVARTRGQRSYFVFDPAAVSTLDEATRDAWIDNGWTLQETQRVDVHPLGDLVAAHLPPDQVVDYLNIDIEGLDLEALETYDFDRFAPKVITIELHDLDLLSTADNTVVRFLTTRGYRLHSYIAITALFVHEQSPAYIKSR